MDIHRRRERRILLCIAVRVLILTLVLHICTRLLQLLSVEVRSAPTILFVLPSPSRERELKHRFAACETLHSLIRHQPPALLAHTGGASSHSIGQTDADFASADWMLDVCIPAHSASSLFLSFSPSVVPTDVYVSSSNEKSQKVVIFLPSLLNHNLFPPSVCCPWQHSLSHQMVCRKAELTACPTHTHSYTFPSLVLFEVVLSFCISLTLFLPR